MESIISHNAEETFEFAYQWGESISQPTIFLLSGDLGAGKTVFTKGIAAGLNIDPADVNSPTFTLINVHAGRMKLYHLDLYRLSGNYEELVELGLDEMVNENNAVVIIEWPERLGSYKLQHAIEITLHQVDDETRRIEWNKPAGN